MIKFFCSSVIARWFCVCAGIAPLGCVPLFSGQSPSEVAAKKQKEKKDKEKNEKGNEDKKNEGEKSSKPQENQLVMKQSVKLGLTEISGMAWLPSTPKLSTEHSKMEAPGIRQPTGGQSVLAVSDLSHVVLVFQVDKQGLPHDPKALDLDPAIKRAGLNSKGSSQWEAVATDDTGNVVILEENPGAIFVFNPTLDTLLNRIELKVGHKGELGKSWHNEANSRGEGLLLMKKGHVLVLKEKLPSMLIEFGPEGHEPLGFAPETRLGAGEAFEFEKAKGATLVPLAHWSFDKDASERMPDISDMTLGGDGIIYLISDETHRIAKLSGSLVLGAGPLALTEVWDLPKNVVQPEAFLLTPAFIPLVGIDAKSEITNFFGLTPLK